LTYLEKKVFSSIKKKYYAVYTPLLYGFVSVGETQYKCVDRDAEEGGD